MVRISVEINDEYNLKLKKLVVEEKGNLHKQSEFIFEILKEAIDRKEAASA